MAFVTPVVEHWLEWERAQWVHHEGLIWRPITPWANALTTEPHLAPLAARVLLYASSHRQDNTRHGLCYTSCGALAGTRKNSMGRSDDPLHHERTLLPRSYTSLLLGTKLNRHLVQCVLFLRLSYCNKLQFTDTEVTVSTLTSSTVNLSLFDFLYFLLPASAWNRNREAC